ncbi:MAG: hypothetical protein Q7R35_06165 [Elusimicrobiota bacterium]|nr:hypothetical protein [Elusimicrobiota bacterium]
MKNKLSGNYRTWIAIAVPVFFLFAAGDLALRSRGALLRADEQALWRDNPGRKAAHYEALFRRQVSAIERDSAGGRLTKEQSGRAAALASAERDFFISESSAKLAFIWYRTAAKDFPSPFNPWAEKAKSKLPAALAAWRAELAAKGVKAEDWMLE